MVRKIKITRKTKRQVKPKITKAKSKAKQKQNQRQVVNVYMNKPEIPPPLITPKQQVKDTSNVLPPNSNDLLRQQTLIGLSGRTVTPSDFSSSQLTNIRNELQGTIKNMEERLMIQNNKNTNEVFDTMGRLEVEHRNQTHHLSDSMVKQIEYIENVIKSGGARLLKSTVAEMYKTSEEIANHIKTYKSISTENLEEEMDNLHTNISTRVGRDIKLLTEQSQASLNQMLETHPDIPEAVLKDITAKINTELQKTSDELTNNVEIMLLDYKKQISEAGTPNRHLDRFAVDSGDEPLLESDDEPKPEPKKRGRPKKKTATGDLPKPEPKKRGRPKKPIV